MGSTRQQRSGARSARSSGRKPWSESAPTRTGARAARWGAPLVALLVGLSGAGVGSAQAQGFGPAPEDLENLGALGAGGETRGAAIEVRQVFEGGPAAAAGLRKGDELVGAGGRPFVAAGPGVPHGPALQLVAQIERCEASRRKEPLELTVRRGGEELELQAPMARLGSHARGCPKKCKKCAAVVRAGLTFLAGAQEPDGRFPTDLGGKTGNVVVTSLGGLAFLSAGVGGPALDKAIQYVLEHAGKAEASPFARGGGGNWNQENWELGYALMFLSEAARKTRRGDLKAKCAELVGLIQQNQEASGGWAHGPGGPNALGYLELEIVSNYVLLGLGAASKLDLELDADKLTKALTWIEGTAAGDGGVGYSQRQGQKGFGEPGRTAGAILAYASLGQTHTPFFAKMVDHLQRNLTKLPEGHVSPAMHLLAGAMASKLLGSRAWSTYMDAFRLHIMASRKPDGSFASTPTEESRSLRSNTDLTVGPCWTTATYVLILSLDEDELPLLLGGEDDGKGRYRPRTGDR